LPSSKGKKKKGRGPLPHAARSVGWEHSLLPLLPSLETNKNEISKKQKNTLLKEEVTKTATKNETERKDEGGTGGPPRKTSK